MATRPAEELLYDSEATLRLVDDALDDIRDLESEHAEMERRLNQIAPGQHRALVERVFTDS